MKKYTDINKETINNWASDNWEWSKPISHEEYVLAKQGKYHLFLTPTKDIKKEWIPDFKDKEVLGFASGGGQQCPILIALGAKVTCLDYSNIQLDREREVAKRENYQIELVEHDYTNPLPFSDNRFDYIIAPVSLCYAKDLDPIFKELYRILKKDGNIFIAFDNSINYLFDEENDEELIVKFSLPFNPLENKELYDYMVKNDYGIQFSHSLEETIGGLLKAGFTIIDIYEDYNNDGKLKEKNIPSYYSLNLKK